MISIKIYLLHKNSSMNYTTAENDRVIDKIYEFLNSLGIVVIEKKIDEPSFLPGLKIENGCLIVDRHALLYPGDILHEAGHIGVCPKNERAMLNDNVVNNRPGTEGEELAAMLWSYAACIHMNINPEIVFHEDGYKGQSEWLLSNYAQKTFIGLPLLAWMGMTSKEGEVDGFPKMIKWLRD